MILYQHEKDIEKLYWFNNEYLLHNQHNIIKQFMIVVKNSTFRPYKSILHMYITGGSLNIIY